MHKITSNLSNYKHFNTVITGKLFLFFKNFVYSIMFKISIKERFKKNLLER